MRIDLHLEKQEQETQTLRVYFRVAVRSPSLSAVYSHFCLWETHLEKSLKTSIEVELHVTILLPGCFCPWTFFENIGFNTVLTDPFMSHLATQLGYSAEEFQALQLIVLAAFGGVD